MQSRLQSSFAASISETDRRRQLQPMRLAHRVTPAQRADNGDNSQASFHEKFSPVKPVNR